jgi:hypothetical protein
MDLFSDTDPKQFIHDFFTAYAAELVDSEEDSATIIDRFHTPDIVEFADGHRMDRAKLIAHARPVRKNRPSSRMEVHEAIAEGDRISTRYTLFVRNRKRDLTMEVYFFGRFAADRRLREAHMLTRTLPSAEEGSA